MKKVVRAVLFMLDILVVILVAFSRIINWSIQKTLDWSGKVEKYELKLKAWDRGDFRKDQLSWYSPRAIRNNLPDFYTILLIPFLLVAIVVEDNIWPFLTRSARSLAGKFRNTKLSK